jgi:hypothetical protein
MRKRMLKRKETTICWNAEDLAQNLPKQDSSILGTPNSSEMTPLAPKGTNKK